MEGKRLHSDADGLRPGLRVLLVEDETIIAMDAEVILQALGVSEVVCVRTVADGLVAIDAGTFDAAILDVRLGQESSLPLAERLAGLGVPFGYLTGYQSTATPVEFKDRPIVSKPFTADDLAGLLRTLLARP